MESPINLESLQEAVGGYIELYHYTTPKGNRFRFVINEEGRLTNLPINPISRFVGEAIFGDVVLLSIEDEL
jgi:hypothetical protein